MSLEFSSDSAYWEGYVESLNFTLIFFFEEILVHIDVDFKAKQKLIS